MTGPLEFVEAAHKQAEQVAQAAADESGGGEWSDEYTPHRSYEVNSHVALHDPAAVLRRIVAERKLLAGHRVHECGDRDCALEPRHQVAFCDACRPGVRWPCATIRALAEGWGWQEEGQ